MYVVDLTTPTCPGGWCGPIDKPYLMFKDDNHWTQTYMRAHFSAPVDALLAAMDRASAPAVRRRARQISVRWKLRWLLLGVGPRWPW